MISSLARSGARIDVAQFLEGLFRVQFYGGVLRTLRFREPALVNRHSH